MKFKKLTANIPNRPPIKQPITSNGKKIPPGAPEPKQIMANANFPTKSATIINAVNFPSISKSTNVSPLPNNWGARKPRIPAKINGINNLWKVFNWSFLLYKLWTYNNALL